MAEIKNNGAYGVRLQFRSMNAAQWDANYVLLAGEIGVELDTRKYKLGDGTTKWSSLGYYSDPTISGAVEALTTRVNTTEEKISSLETTMSNQGTRLSTAEGKITTLETASSDHGTRLGTAESTISTHTTNIGKNASDIAVNAANITTNAGKIKALEDITVISGNPAN